jgi:hypothetical protein
MNQRPPLSSSLGKDSEGPRKIYRTLQVQVVHRHGDRSPITPLKDESFWSSTLIPEALLTKISSNTALVESSQVNLHKANGRGPFGKLTELGLLQMIQVGSTLREKFVAKDEDDYFIDKDGNRHYPHAWKPSRPLCPDNIRVFSTNFSRTIQSVQGLLVGLFPDGTDHAISIDVRNTNWMLPDPQPRRSQEQELLEDRLAMRDYIVERERQMAPLAARVTQVLHNLLASDAREVSFGVAQEHAGESSIETEPLAWNQLAEITTCLAVRNRLPLGITKEDQEAISKHVAWRWFENLKEPHLAYLSMNRFVSQQLSYFQKFTSEPPVTIWSAHDSTLIGLLCAYRLEMPATWPDYASYLVMELIEVDDHDSKEQFVRFSLNGEVLSSNWGESLEMIPLDVLVEKIQTEGSTATSCVSDSEAPE